MTFCNLQGKSLKELSSQDISNASHIIELNISNNKLTKFTNILNVSTTIIMPISILKSSQKNQLKSLESQIFKTQGGEGDLSALTFTTKLNLRLFINQFVIDDFGDALFDVIHSAHPLHLVVGFQFLRDAICFLILQQYRIIRRRQTNTNQLSPRR